VPARFFGGREIDTNNDDGISAVRRAHGATATVFVKDAAAGNADLPRRNACCF
jgi:hypothetical protein